MQRNYAVDLLKSICMIMVVLLHATNYGMRNMEIEPLSAVDTIATLLSSFSVVAVNCFVLITGYYSSKSCTLDYRKLMAMWIQVFMYAVGVYCICTCFTDGGQLEIKTLIRKAFPLLTNQYWFFTVYMLLMLVSPYINLLINGIDRKNYHRMVIGCGMLFSVIPSINIFGDPFGTQNGYSLIWFVILYISAGYIRRFKPKKHRYGLYYLGFGSVIFIVRLLASFMKMRQYPNIAVTVLNLQTQYNSPIVFLASISLFLFALNQKIELNGFEKLFGKVASLSFSVYLLHENDSIRDMLWTHWVCLEKVGNNALYFVVRLIGAVTIIFVTGIVVEWIRRLVCMQIRKTMHLSA